MTATRSLVIERELSHAREKVWRALTQGALIREWLLDNDFEPVVGHRFKFRSTPAPNWDGVIDSEVLVVEAGKKLSYSWNSMGLESVVVFTLFASSGGTLLRMEQSGFRSDQEVAYKGANYGWQKFLGGLERVVGGIQ
ncbi:MAG: SRPBCC domain-containing protein [Casimicrobiaceae bacterium]